MYKMSFKFLRKLLQGVSNNDLKIEDEYYANKHMVKYAYDFDGVISIGITPRSSQDFIITGRCIDEKDEVMEVLKERGITNPIYFNPMTLEQRGNHTLKARRFSGTHKAKTLERLKSDGYEIVRFFEDDPVQLKIIKTSHPKLDVVHIKSDLVQK
jgi:predicted transcriptional regulator